MFRYLMLWALAALWAQADLQGRPPVRSLEGVVADSAGSGPLVGASVLLMTPGDTLLRITDSRGAFRFESVRDSSVRLRIGYLGYRGTTRNVSTTAGTNRIDTVFLGEIPISLGEIVVQGRRPLMSERGDTIVYHAENVRVLPGDEALQIVRGLPGMELQGRRSPLHGQNDRADLRRRPSAVRRERPLGPRLSGGQRRGRHSGLRRTARGGAAQGQQERQETHGNEPRYAQQAREKRQRRGAGRLRSRHRPGPRRTPQGTLRSRRFVQLFLGTAHLLGRGEQQQQQSVVQPHPRPVRLIRGRRRRRPPQHDARRQPDAPLRQASDPVGKLPLRQRAVGNAADHATDLFPVGSLPVAQLHRHDPSLAPRQTTLGQSRSAL